MLRREVLSNVHISIFPFVESCFGPGPAGPDPDQTVSRVIGPTEHMPQKYLILGKESPRDAHRIARSQTLFKRQGASEGVSRRHVVTCRPYPPPVLQPLALGRRLSHPHWASSREVPLGPNPTQPHLPDGVSSNETRIPRARDCHFDPARIPRAAPDQSTAVTLR